MIKTILLTVIATITISYSNAQAELKMTAKQIKIRNKQVEINYYQKGKGETTLLFIHGWCINAMYWSDQMEYFSETHHVCAIDLPGFGKSTAERTQWTIEEYADDVSAFMDSMNLKNVVIIGHSMAGEIMLQLALTNNSRLAGIVGVDNFKLIDFEFTPEQTKQMNEFFPMLKKDFKNSATSYADMMLFHETTLEGVKNRVKTDFANCDSVIGYETCINQVQYSYADAQRLEQLNYKLHLINSEYMPTNEVGLRSHCKSGFQIKTISLTGHYPMIEKPNEFNRLLEEILSDF